MLTLSDLHYDYHAESFQFDLHVEAGQIVALMGPSGAGKSTLLALMAGFIEPLSGEILAQGQTLNGLAPYQRPFAMLFQEHNLFAHLTVSENIGLGLDPGLKLSATQKQAVVQAAQQVGVAEYLSRLPHELSGGQRQRVALARCFVQSAPIWLLDEPFSALDPLLRLEMLSLVKQLASERDITVVMVTHHLGDAKAIATHFAFVSQGHVAATGPISELAATHSDPSLGAFVQAATTAHN